MQNEVNNTEARSGHCLQDGCTYLTGGSCLEGFSTEEIGKCPHFSLVIERPFPEAEKATTITTPQPSSLRDLETAEKLSLYSGQALTLVEANALAAQHKVDVIVLAGPADSGKTTFCNSLYQQFLNGSFAGYLFAGSKTLLGFEQRCHLSRIDSMRLKSDTERTKTTAEDLLLHLSVQDTKFRHPPLHFLLSDLSGELFDAARQSNEAFLQIPLMRSAARLVILFDGEKLADLDRRLSAKQEVLTLLRTVVETGVLWPGASVDILFTKQDLVLRANSKGVAQAFQDRIESEISGGYGSSFDELTFHRIASRSEIAAIPDAFGLDHVFRKWVERKPPKIDRKAWLTGVADDQPRQINRFIWKVRLPR